MCCICQMSQFKTMSESSELAQARHNTRKHHSIEKVKMKQPNNGTLVQHK